MNLRGRSVVITGASTGIGASLAVALARRGARLVLAARNADALEEVARQCRDAGGEALVVPTDVTLLADCERLSDEAARAYGGIDVFVNNAGVSAWARFDEITDMTIFERLMKVNYLGSVYATRYALPHLKRSQGLLVAVSSLTGKTGVPTRSAYGATKHAMQGFFDSLRVELRGTGVDVMVVSPGFVATGIRALALGPDGKPRGESPREEKGSDTMGIDECTNLIVEGIVKRRREVVMTRTARLGLWLKLVAPGLVDLIAERAVREKDG